MKEFKGTKGNWTVDIDTAEETDHAAQLVRSETDIVCLVSPADDICEISTANANLLAAAPELLSKLQESNDKFKSLVKHNLIKGVGVIASVQHLVRTNDQQLNKALGHE